MTNTHKHKILLDFTFASRGVAGIPQDTRLTFKALHDLDAVSKIDTLLYPYHLGNGAFELTNKDDIEEQLVALSRTLNLKLSTTSLYSPVIQKLSNTLSKVTQLTAACKELTRIKHEIKKIEKDVFTDTLWRNLFKGTLEQKDLQKIFKKTDFLLGNFSSFKLAILGYYLRHVPFINNQIKLDTSDYNFFITQRCLPFKISNNTKLIIRYHDSFPITNFDTCAGNQKYFSHMLKEYSDRAFFVCNSEPTRAKLIKIMPTLETRTFVVPCVVSNHYKKTIDQHRLKSLLSTTKPYVLFVSTLEPRKNVISLIKAWHPLYLKHGLRLVVCGKPGWKCKEISDIMQAPIEESALIHLENVPTDELALLYSHAKALVFPSYAEGFGMPVCEAMRCECPTIISDIEEHRWLAGDASLYCDPYDVNDIRGKIEELLFAKDSTSLRKKLVKKGLEQSKLYELERVSDAWREVLNHISMLPEVPTSLSTRAPRDDQSHTYTK